MAPARSPRVAEVVETIALSPSLVRIIFAGPGLAGFTAGPFTDHYVKLMFPQGDYETVGGLVLERLGRVPKPGDTLAVGRVRLEVTRASARAVHELRIHEGRR